MIITLLLIIQILSVFNCDIESNITMDVVTSVKLFPKMHLYIQFKQLFFD